MGGAGEGVSGSRPPQPDKSSQEGGARGSRRDVTWDVRGREDTGSDGAGRLGAGSRDQRVTGRMARRGRSGAG